MNKEPIGQASAEQIEQWKKANKDGIFKIEVGGHVAYFRNPNLDDLNFAASQVDADAPLDFNRTVMRETILAGSEAIFDDTKLFMGASKQIAKKIDGEKAKLSDL